MKKYKKKILIILLMGMTIFVLKITYDNFKEYKRMILTQQQENLLIISKSLSRSLELYIKEKERGLQSLAKILQLEKKEKKENLKFFYESQKGEFFGLIYYDLENNKILSYPEIIEENNKSEDIYSKRVSYIGEIYLLREKEFGFNISVPIINKNGEFQGIVVGIISMNNLDNLLVKPFKLNEYKYAHVKDSTGLILITEAQEQIGNHVVASRKKKYPDLDYKELEELIRFQRDEEEGSRVYFSYWWPDKHLKKIKKINAFSRAQITPSFWIVSIVMEYNIVEEPILNYLKNNLIITIFLVLFFSGLVYMLTEIFHLRELSHKEAQLNHKKRLETIGTLAGSIAHEFNNLLTPILGYSELLMYEYDKKDKIYEDLTLIYNSAKRAQELTKEIMDFSRKKKIEVEYKFIPANLIMENFLTYGRKILPPHIELKEYIEKKCGNVFVNETKVQQMLLNIFINAYQAVEKEKGKITIGLKSIKKDEDLRIPSDEEEKNFIKISIEDNGSGIEKKDLQEIFNPFFSKGKSENGNGLGLYLVKKTIEEHRGYIFVLSKKKKGTVFEILIPRKENYIMEDNYKKYNKICIQHSSDIIENS